MTERGRVMAIDYGDKRIGLALSDPTRTIASPLGHIVRRAGKRPPLAEIMRRAAEHEVTALVIGLPLDQEGDDTARAAEVRAIAVELEKRTAMPVTLVDERYSSVEAAARLRVDPGAGPHGLDCAAAQLILQQHFDDRGR